MFVCARTSAQPLRPPAPPLARSQAKSTGERTHSDAASNDIHDIAKKRDRICNEEHEAHKKRAAHDSPRDLRAGLLGSCGTGDKTRQGMGRRVGCGLGGGAKRGRAWGGAMKAE